METIDTRFTVFKRGVKGEVRFWRMCLGIDGPGSDDVFGHRTESGIYESTMTDSNWTYVAPKNVGRVNATTSFSQAESEIDSAYELKLRSGYFRDINAIDKLAFTKPMLATDWDKQKSKVNLSEGVYAQPKLDGIRCIARADGLFTRSGKPILAVPHIWDALVHLFQYEPDLILDGELYNHDLKDNFNAIVGAVRRANPKGADIEVAKSIQYHVYDIPSSYKAFGSRIQDVHSTLTGANDCIKIVPTAFVMSENILDNYYSGWMEEGYEGQMIRLAHVPYENKRSNSLMKRKDFMTEEFPVDDMSEGKGNWAGCTKTVTVTLPNGNSCEATLRGTKETLTKLWAEQIPDWATVRFFGYTPDGMLRFPIAIDYGYGKRTD